MRIENAKFLPLNHWANQECKTLEDVLDFSRCLENIAYPTMPKWRIWGGSEEKAKPDVKTMLACPEYNLTVPNTDQTVKTGWIATELQVPLIAQMADTGSWGDWKFEFNGWYDPDIYCDDKLVEEYVFMYASLKVCTADDINDKPWIYIRIPAPQNKPIGNIMARSSLSGLDEYNKRIRDMARSLRTCCNLLSTENRRDNLYLKGEVDINHSKLGKEERNELITALLKAANSVELKTIADKNITGFMESLEACRILLNPLAKYAKKFTVYFIGHSHIDLAWKWRWPETVECMKGTLETQLDLMEREKDYVYVESSPVVWKALYEKYPKMWERCRKAAQRGQFEPQGAMWCEPDGMCLGAESWIRQILHGQKAAKEFCGKESKCGFNIDAFGFNAGLPKIYKEAGIESFVTQKFRYNEFTIFPYIHFWWEGDDGSRILGLHVYPSHSNHIDADEISSIVRVHHLTDGIYNIPVMWGYGNHGGGPQPRMMDRIDELKTLTVYPHIQYSGFNRYFDIARQEEQEALENIPVIKNELFLETHHKTYTVQGRIKEANRTCERELLTAEALAAIAADENLEYPKSLLDDAWQKEMFNQFHDLISGTSFPSVYQDVCEDYEKAVQNINQVKKMAVDKLLGTGDTQYIFNPLAWNRDAVIRMCVIESEEKGLLKDSRGNVVPFQKTAEGNEVVFIAKDLPGLGFETYKKTPGTVVDTGLQSGEDWVHNPYMQVCFDTEKGVVKSLKIQGQEMADGGIGALKLLEDTQFRDYETWNMGLTGKEYEPDCISFEKIEEGPVRVVFRAKYTFGLWEKKKPYFGLILWHTPAVDYPTSFFTQDFIIYADSNRVECVLNTDWWEDRMVLKAAAETSLENTRAFYNVPYGVIERPTKRETDWEKARYEVPANVWADLCDGRMGLAIFNRSRHGYDALDGRLRLTLLTAPWGDNKALVSDPLADRGKHKIEYAFYPHPGNYCDSEVHRYACEYEYPAVALNGSETSIVAVGQEYLNINPKDFIVTSIKREEEGSGMIVRGFEAYGNQVDMKMNGILAEKQINRVCIMEKDINNDSNPIHIDAHKIATFKLG